MGLNGASKVLDGAVSLTDVSIVGNGPMNPLDVPNDTVGLTGILNGAEC